MLILHHQPALDPIAYGLCMIHWINWIFRDHTKISGYFGIFIPIGLSQISHGIQISRNTIGSSHDFGRFRACSPSCILRPRARSNIPLNAVALGVPGALRGALGAQDGDGGHGKPDQQLDRPRYPLVICDIAIENGHL